MSNDIQSLTVKSFIHKVLNGTAIGVIVSLLPNSMFAVLFALPFFVNNPFFATWSVLRMFYFNQHYLES